MAATTPPADAPIPRWLSSDAYRRAILFSRIARDCVTGLLIGSSTCALTLLLTNASLPRTSLAVLWALQLVLAGAAIHASRIAMASTSDTRLHPSTLVIPISNAVAIVAYLASILSTSASTRGGIPHESNLWWFTVALAVFFMVTSAIQRRVLEETIDSLQSTRATLDKLTPAELQRLAEASSTAPDTGQPEPPPA